MLPSHGNLTDLLCNLSLQEDGKEEKKEGKGEGKGEGKEGKGKDGKGKGKGKGSSPLELLRQCFERHC